MRSSRAKFSTLIAFAFLPIISGCGGGGGAGATKLNFPLPVDTNRYISGTARAPQGASLVREAGRGASAVQGLGAVKDGTTVSLYRIDNNGGVVGSALSTATTSGGGFYLAIPASVTDFTSDLVVQVGSAENTMRAFVVSTGQLTIDPVSEYVVDEVVRQDAPLSDFSMAEVSGLYSRVSKKADEVTISLSAAGSVSSATAALRGNASLKSEMVSGLKEIEGTDYCKYNDCGAGADEDAFGNIMHMSYIKIKSVEFSAPSANAPAKVTVKTEIIGGEDEDVMPFVESGKVTYITGGDLKTRKSVDMSCVAGSCSGNIPALAAGAKVTFAVSLVDSNGNTTMEGLPMASPDDAANALLSGVPDMDNTEDIVPADLDMIGLSAGFDKDRVYVSYSVEGNVSGGTMDPPYIHVYGIKISNPDIEQNEGLMVGKLWVNMPLMKEKAWLDKFLPLFMQQKELIDNIGQDNLQNIYDTGMIVIDVGKLLGGNMKEGLLLSAKPEGKIVNNNIFIGSILRSPLGDNPSGFVRIITLTAANASVDSFMPIPLNCSHFLNLYFTNHEYTVK